MPMLLKGSCRCGAVHFEMPSHTPVPYQLCYCSICRKTQGGGGFSINLGALTDGMQVGGEEGRAAIGIYRAEIERDTGCEISSGERNFCTRCGTALWLWSPDWPDLIHPFASAIDTPLPRAPSRVHMMLANRPDWVPPPDDPADACFNGYPTLSLADWHRQNGLWVD